MQLIIMLVFGVLCALIAHSKGRSAIGWFLIGFFFTLIGLIISLVVSNLKIEEERHQKMARENRRLREQLRKDRMVADRRHRQAMRRIDAHDRVSGIDTAPADEHELLEYSDDGFADEEDDDAIEIDIPSNQAPRRPRPRNRAMRERDEYIEREDDY